MGGNVSYDKVLGGVVEGKRTHYDTGYRIDGHKVVIFKENTSHDKFIMNSNSEHPIYLIASADEKTNEIIVSGIAIYNKHQLTESIDLKFDNDGNIIPFDDSENGSHSHKWTEISPGVLGRTSHDKSNHLPIDKKYEHLMDRIADFNKQRKIWKQVQ